MTKLLVSGASGQFGQIVVNHLIVQLGIDPTSIIGTTRSPDKLAHLSDKGVDVRYADFDDPASLAQAFAGAVNLLLISGGDVGRRLEQHTQAIKAAAEAGVQHLIYTSMPEPEQSPITFAGEHLGTEQAISASDLPSWTILRNH